MDKDSRPSVAEIALTGERRASERVSQPFRAVVRGIARTGDPFSVEAVVDNMSTGGLYVRLPLEMALGARTRAVVSFTTSPASEQLASRLWLSGKVVRVEPGHDGSCGTAISMDDYGFLPGAKFRSAFDWARDDA